MRDEPQFLDDEPPHWAATGLSRLLMLVFAVAIVILLVIQVPETVSGRFMLNPVRGADPVRAERDGVVTDIPVREGDRVTNGQVIATMRSFTMNDRVADRRTLDAQVTADSARLAIARQRALSRQRAQEGEAQRLSARIVHLTGLLASRGRRLALAREIADSAAQGAHRGVIGKFEAAQLDLNARALAEEHEVTRSELVEAEADLARLGEARVDARLQDQAEQGALSESIHAGQLRADVLREDLPTSSVAGLVVRAPCAGTVLKVHVNREGAVVRDGEPLTEIACDGEPLQGEVVIPQAGVGLVRPGQPVRLRYDAFPYQRFGVMEGRLRWSGRAGIVSKDREIFRALVDLSRTNVRVQGEDRPVLAGMGGRADIVVGRRTLGSYVMEPLRALRSQFSQATP